MPDRIQLPDGRYVEIPDNASPEFMAELQKQIREMFPDSPAQAPAQGLVGDIIRQQAQISQGFSLGPIGTGSPVAGQPSERNLGEGTVLGSAWEGIKSIPRGTRQFAIMAQQGFEGLRTPDEDTDREKELRQRMDDLMMEIDPRYRDANLVNVGMGLGQVAGMMGLGAGAAALGAGGVGAAVVAGTATGLMGAGEQASRIAEFEERTGQDVSAEKEKQALALGLGIGLTEIAPLGKFARSLGISRMAGAKIFDSMADSAVDMTRGQLLTSLMRQAGEEAAQEGVAGFSQSAVARYLYDDDALADAGAEALREALVGGQVGAITDAFVKMSTRAVGNRRGSSVDSRNNQQLSRGAARRLGEGTLNVEEIKALVTGADSDQTLAELRDSIVTLGPDGRFVVREDEGSFALQNKERQRLELEAVEELFSSGRFGDPSTAEARAAYEEAIRPVQTRMENFNREMSILVAAYQAQQDGRLGGAADPAEEAAEAEAETINAVITPAEAAQEELQEEFLEQNAEVGTVTPEPTVDQMGAPVSIPILDIAAQLEARLGKSDREIALEEDRRVQKQANDLGLQLVPINERIEATQERFNEAEFDARNVDEAKIEEKTAVLTRDLEILDNGSAVLEQGDTELNAAIQSLDRELAAGAIDQETYAAELNAIVEESESNLTALEEEASIEEGGVLGINQLKEQLGPALDVDFRGATTKKGVNESWVNEDRAAREGYTKKDIAAIRKNKKTLRKLEKDRRQLVAQIKRVDPRINRDELQKTLNNLQAQKRSLLDPADPSNPVVVTEDVTVQDMARRGVEPYVTQFKNEVEKVTESITLSLKRKGLKGKKLKEEIARQLGLWVDSDGFGLGQAPVERVLSGGNLVSDLDRRNAERDRSVREARANNDVRINTEAARPPIRDEDARFELQQRLKSQEQREAYQQLVSRIAEDPNQTLSVAETRFFLQSILSGGEEGGLLTQVHDVGLTEDKLQRIGASSQRARQKADRDSAGNVRRADALALDKSVGDSQLLLAMESLLGLEAIPEIEQAFDAVARDKPAPTAWKGISLGKLGDAFLIKLRKDLQSRNFNIQLDDLAFVLRNKGFIVPDNLNGSEFLSQLIEDTLGTDESFADLHRAEREVLLARILTSEPVGPVTEAKQVKAMAVKENLQDIDTGEAAQGKTQDQKVSEAKNLYEAEQRIKTFKESILKSFKKLGLGDLAIQFMADADQVYSGVKDVIVNGAFVIDENGENVLDENGQPVYRAAYEGGAVAALEGYGTRVMFNLSQIVQEYGDNWHLKIDEIVANVTAHEGAHVHFIRDLISTTERRAFEKLGRTEGKVPASVNQEAHNKKLTWEQYVKELYPDLEGADLTEETSVHIFNAIAQGKFEKKDTAGLIGKVKQRLAGMFGAIADGMYEAELVPVMQAFERIQNLDVMKERAKRKRSDQGLHSLQYVDRAKQEDLRVLSEAVEDGDQAAIDAAVNTILDSRHEFRDKRTDLERLQESLLSELRARKEIEGNPSNAYAPVLNKQAIEAGEVTAESLNAYFRFVDGRVPPSRMPPERMELRTDRAGKSNTVLNKAEMSLVERIKAEGRVFRGELAPAEAIIRTMDSHNVWVDKTGKERYVGTQDDFQEMLEYTGFQIFTEKFLDKRLPQWKSTKRALRREIKLYGEALTRMAHSSASAAWRIADNSSNMMDLVRNIGPLQYKNGGFVTNEVDENGDKVPLYARDTSQIDPETGEAGFKRDANGDKIPVKGLNAIRETLLRAGEDVIMMATDYMAALRILDVYKKVEEAQLDLTQARLTANPQLILEARQNLDEWQDAYDRTNPKQKKTGKRFYPLEDARKRKQEVESDGADASRAVVEFAQEYADFNYYQIEFAMDTGLLGRRRGKIMQSMAYVPFYRDSGWQNVSPLENPNNTYVDKSNKEADENDWVARGAPLLDKSIRGSFQPISSDLLANLEKNATAMVRDGMLNVAATRSMRDESVNGTAVEIETISAREYARKAFLTKTLKKEGDLTAEEQLLKAELDALNARIKLVEQNEKQLVEELRLQGFSEIRVRVKGVSLIPALEKVLDENGQEVIDPNTGLPKTKTVPVEMQDGGVDKTYLVMDPLLSRSIMDIGFSPKQAIEDFFGKTLGIKSERFNKGVASLAVGSSELLREAVTRAPPFFINNQFRDSIQAGVIYGKDYKGQIGLMLASWKNFLDSDIVNKAEARGLGIAVDYQPDDQETRWNATIPFVGTLWNQLGHWSKRSEVATRMAVYDHAINATDGDAAEALYQAIEIINYGRRGSSRLFTTIAAMAPFMNGRVQGLSVLVRNHTGALDAPGLFLEEGDKMDEGRVRLARAANAFSRGALIATATLVYWMIMHDEEEYKNLRDDTRADNWLIPLGTGKDGRPRPAFKLPTPFEAGLLYKIIPEEILRMISEEEHDVGDFTEQMKRQITASLYFDLRPQLVRPVIDAMTNRDAFQRDTIIPSWMQETVAATEQYNPYTSMVARLTGDTLSKIPFVKNLDFLTSPMKIEYMLRQYTGSIGSYLMMVSDRVAREVMNENVAGTAADFGSLSDPFNPRTISNLPILGSFFQDLAKGGGYQEDFYEAQTQIDALVTTLGQIREHRGYEAAQEFEQKHKGLFDQKRRMSYFDRRMKHYREERDRLFNRNDLTTEEKRRHMQRMFETRDDMLEEMLKIMADIRKERSLLDNIIGE